MSETVAPAPRTSQIEAPVAAEFIRSPDPSLPTNTVAEEGDGIAVADGALVWRISPLEAARLVWEAPWVGDERLRRLVYTIHAESASARSGKPAALRVRRSHPLGLRDE
jgi:hypothetical protein